MNYKTYSVLEVGWNEYPRLEFHIQKKVAEKAE